MTKKTTVEILTIAKEKTGAPVDLLIKVANLLPEISRQNELEKLKVACVAQGRVMDVHKITQALDQETTVAEKQAMIRVLVRNGCVGGAHVLIKELPEDVFAGMTKTLLALAVKEGDLEVADEYAQSCNRSLTVRELLTIFKVQLREGLEVSTVVERLGKRLPVKLLSEIRNTFVSDGSVSEARIIAGVMQTPLQPAELDLLQSEAMQTGNFTRLSQVLDLRPNKNRRVILSSLLREAMEEGDLFKAAGIAGLRGNQLTSRQLWEIFDNNLKKHDWRSAEATADRLSGRKKEQALIVLLKYHVGRKTKYYAERILEKLLS